MPHDELKPKDRVVLRMTRDGAVEENLTEGTSEKVSKRLEDAQLVAPHDTETGDLAEEVRKRRQLRPDELEDAEGQAQAETQPADAAQEYKPGDLPVSDDPTSHTLHSETYRTMPIPLTTEKHLPILLLPARSADLVLKGRLTGRLFWKGRLKPPPRYRTLAAMPQLPGGLSVWSANPRRRMSVWMPPVRNCPPKRF